jgi:hypothetical protein
MYTPQAPDTGQIVVAIPVRDEEERIGSCLSALTDQVGAQADHIVLLVNNTTDDSIAEARRVPMPDGTRLHVLQRTLPPMFSNAGHARRLAMEHAATLAGRRGILLTTDADGRADPDWLAANLREIAQGADVVAGWIDLDAVEWATIPMSLHEADARECAYDNLCDEIHGRLDPDPFDPLPRHTQNSGASIAVTAAAYAASGGIPHVPFGEDRAFLAALRRIDARIRHSLACHVVVSGRTEGRAPGGMAETIRRRMEMPDLFLDDRLEPAVDCVRRAMLRRAFREGVDDRIALAVMAGLEPPLVERMLGQPRFGAVWAAVEAASPMLRPRRVAVADLSREMAEAERICAALRNRPDAAAMPLEVALVASMPR